MLKLINALEKLAIMLITLLATNFLQMFVNCQLIDQLHYTIHYIQK